MINCRSCVVEAEFRFQTLKFIFRPTGSIGEGVRFGPQFLACQAFACKQMLTRFLLRIAGSPRLMETVLLIVAGYRNNNPETC